MKELLGTLREDSCDCLAAETVAERLQPEASLSVYVVVEQGSQALVNIHKPLEMGKNEDPHGVHGNLREVVQTCNVE